VFDFFSVLVQLVSRKLDTAKKARLMRTPKKRCRPTAEEIASAVRPVPCNVSFGGLVDHAL
jgi:hypothetical protein